MKSEAQIQIFFFLAQASTHYALDYSVLSKVKGAIKKMYAQPVSIVGYASPCKWGIFHIDMKLRQEKIVFHRHETRTCVVNYINKANGEYLT